MNLEKFQDLPDESRLWVYGFESRLHQEQMELVRKTLSEFLVEWATHGVPVQGAFDFFEDRFVVLSGFAEGGISGCAVDSSVRVFKQLCEKGLNLLDHGRIYFRDSGGTIRSLHFNDFRAAIESGEVSEATPVFDTHVNSLGNLRREGLEKSFTQSWHAQAFSLPKAAAR